jgi:acylpyruvate hydrolase
MRLRAAGIQVFRGGRAMKLVTIEAGRDGEAGAILANGEILHLVRAGREGTPEAWIPDSLRRILAAGPAGLDVIRALIKRIEALSEAERATLRAAQIVTPYATTRLRAPLPEPRLIIGGGLNYRSHLKEMSGTPEPSRPTGFVKTAASVTGPESIIRLPPQNASMVDWEGELACVIGRPCHNVSAAEAMDYVAGFTIINDVSARDWVHDVFKASTPWDARLTWEVNIMGKQFAGFTAMGPVLATTDEVGDPNDLTLETRLNGEVVQHVHTSDVIFDFAASLAFFSRWYAFSPGDLITTGTPAGVGVGRKPPKFMQAGDTIEVEISRIGLLRNRIGPASQTD